MNYIPNNVTDCIIEADMALEKGLFILGNLTTEYPFDGEMTEDKRRAWLFECQRILTLMDIAFDYMATASKTIERAKQIDSENREKAASQKVGVVA